MGASGAKGVKAVFEMGRRKGANSGELRLLGEPVAVAKVEVVHDGSGPLLDAKFGQHKLFQESLVCDEGMHASLHSSLSSGAQLHSSQVGQVDGH